MANRVHWRIKWESEDENYVVWVPSESNVEGINIEPLTSEK